MFIGRENELKDLNELYNQDGFQFVVVYGRRRVGKTTLLGEFCKDKDSIFFVAQEENEKLLLESFSEVIFNHFGIGEISSPFESWQKLFLFIGEKAKKERLVLVIDEYPYLVGANKGIPSILQNLIDHHLKNTNLYIIVCGSSVSFMEKEVLGYKSPLYGRRTAQMKIEAFDYLDSSKFLSHFSNEDKIISYGILGGIAQYLGKFSSKDSIESNIKSRILNKNAFLFEEPKNLLKQELREPLVYNSIIESIAKGASKINEIATKTQEENSKCNKYIATLIEMGIVKKETPFGVKENTKKSIYKIEDNLFRFWYKFVFDNYSLIDLGLIDIAYEKKIRDEINNYMGPIFEDVCLQFLKNANRKGLLPFVFEKYGRWWGTNNSTRKQEEIDIVASNDENMMLCECKWRNEKSDFNVLENLMTKGGVFENKNKYYAIFSKAGFSETVINSAKSNNKILLFTLDNLFD